jgi:hypothetical protein
MVAAQRPVSLCLAFAPASGPTSKNRFCRLRNDLTRIKGASGFLRYPGG